MEIINHRLLDSNLGNRHVKGQQAGSCVLMHMCDRAFAEVRSCEQGIDWGFTFMRSKSSSKGLSAMMQPVVGFS